MIRAFPILALVVVTSTSLTVSDASAFGLHGFRGASSGFSRVTPSRPYSFNGFTPNRTVSAPSQVFCLPGYIFNAYLHECVRGRQERPHPPRPD